MVSSCLADFIQLGLKHSFMPSVDQWMHMRQCVSNAAWHVCILDISHFKTNAPQCIAYSIFLVFSVPPRRHSIHTAEILTRIIDASKIKMPYITRSLAAKKASSVKGRIGYGRLVNLNRNDGRYVLHDDLHFLHCRTIITRPEPVFQ